MDAKNIIKLNETLVISSRIIAEELGKEHSDVTNKIKSCLNIGEWSLGVRSESDTIEAIESSYVNIQNNQEYKEYLVTKDGFILLMMNYIGYNDFKRAYIAYFNKMEKALRDLEWRIGDKKHQVECMRILHDMLPEDEQNDKLSYIKINTVVNKVTSEVFGFPKSLKKAEMNPDMLKLREKVQEDYLKLYEVLDDNSAVTDTLYSKYSKRLFQTRQDAKLALENKINEVGELN